MSHSRRPSISIYDYPEHLNPFSDDAAHSQPQIQRDGKSKDPKNKFWTFGRSRKKRSNSFSIKSTWSGFFGKRKDVPETQANRLTITTVSSTYKREPDVRPVAPPRTSKDQQEFDEALGTLARRRKYTLDNSSRYGSSLTVNGDPARIYEGSPQDTTASIMGDLTPKPPARRFGQVSPRPTDKIPPLNYREKSPKQNGDVALRENVQERTPVAPLRRFGNRSSQRLYGSPFDLEEDSAGRMADVTLRDENENVPEDYVFKRCSQDVVRKSNLSINSCVSVTSTASTYGRKKRRAPLPPRLDQLEAPEEKVVQTTSKPSNVELHIVEAIDIAKVAENIDEMTMKSRETEEEERKQEVRTMETISDDKEKRTTDDISKGTTHSDVAAEDDESIPKNPVEPAPDTELDEKRGDICQDSRKEEGDSEVPIEIKKEEVEIEYRRRSQDNLEIMKDVDEFGSRSELEVCLRKKGSTETLSRSDSFSVKEEIEKIERQIKALETKSTVGDAVEGEPEETTVEGGRRSIQENRRHFFQNMVDEEVGRKGVRVELKELPREQKDIRVIRLTDSPVPVVAPREPVKVIELHISEPIRQKPEIVEDVVNPIPKPRRHSALALNGSQSNVIQPCGRKSYDGSDKRGQSF